MSAVNLGSGIGQINYSRVARFLNSNKEQALYMGWWDKFKDLFRSLIGTPKEEQLNQLWAKLQANENRNTNKDIGSYFTAYGVDPQEASGLQDGPTKSQANEIIRKINVFSQIRNLLVDPTAKSSFKILLTRQGLDFKINNHTIKSIPIDEKIGIMNKNILAALEENNWGLVLDIPKTKNAETREIFNESVIKANKKQALDVYKLLVENKLDTIEGEDKKFTTVKLIIHFNQICNLLLRHEFGLTVSYAELSKIAEPIFANLQLDENQKNQFIRATIWLNFHRNTGQLIKQVLKAAAIPIAFAGGVVLGVLAGPVVGGLAGCLYGATTNRSCLASLLFSGLGLTFGTVITPIILASLFTVLVGYINTGDSLSSCTKSFGLAQRSLLEAVKDDSRYFILAGLPSMEVIVNRLLFNNENFIQECNANMELLEKNGSLQLKPVEPQANSSALEQARQLIAMFKPDVTRRASFGEY